MYIIMVVVYRSPWVPSRMTLGTELNSTEILNQVWSGRPLIILDDRREFEGDIFCAAEVVTPEVLQFMIRKASGLLCMSMPRTELERMGIPRLSDLFEYLDIDRYEVYHPDGPVARFYRSLASRDTANTPFHVPVDFRGQASGISVLDRYATIKALLSGDFSIDDFDVPGHLFTLGAHPDGLEGRKGHTESVVDLCKIAGLKPAGLLCEVVGDEGEMLRGDELESFARINDLEILPLSRIPDLKTGRR